MTSINPYVEFSIKIFIFNYLKINKYCSLSDILNHYNHIENATEFDIRQTVYNMKKSNELIFSSSDSFSDSSLFSLSDKFQLTDINGNKTFQIVVSKPKMRELTFQNAENRSHQIDSIDCFKNLIRSTMFCLRVSSPFFQENVCEAIPEIKDLFFNLFSKNIEIRLLTRELKVEPKRVKEVQWLVDLSKQMGCRHLLKIHDYHITDSQNRMISGTHAKIILAD